MVMHQINYDLALIKQRIRSIPNWPIEGVMFRDITLVLQDPQSLRAACDFLIDRYNFSALSKIVAIDARGFIFGAVVAYALGIGFVPIRKKGKLPFQTYEESYDLEYGNANLNIHKDALHSEDRVVIIDDVIATGGTLKAAVDLVKRFGCTLVEVGALIELSELKGRQLLDPDIYFYSVVQLNENE